MRKLLVTRFHLLLLGLLAAITATAFVKVPEATGLPVHWGLDGKPDQIWPRDQALWVFPSIAIVLIAISLLIGRLASGEQLDAGRPVLETVIAGLLALCCALQFAFLLIGIGSDIDMLRLLAFALAALFVALGAALPRARPNVYAGIRLPWTMKSPQTWRATHRLTGVLMAAAGLSLAVVALLWPAPATLLVAIGLAVFLPTLVGAIFSFVVSRR